MHPGQMVHVRAEFRRLYNGRPVVRIGEQHVDVEMADVTLVEPVTIKVGDVVRVAHITFDSKDHWIVHALDNEKAWVKRRKPYSKDVSDLFIALDQLRVAA